MSPAIRVSQLGAPARHSLTSAGPWTVAAVFPRAVYLNRAADWICLVPDAAGPGPLYVCCANPPGWTASVAVGDPFPLPDLSGAATWVPPRPDRDTQASRAAGLTNLDAWLAANPPPTDGLGIFAQLNPATSTPVAKRAMPAIAALNAGQVDRITGLIGLGPGLTPSGDDLLGAHIVTLGVSGDTAAARRLAATVAPALDRTTPISAAYLRTALTGQASARVPAVINAVISGADLDADCAALTAVGHTSGWDALAGIAIAIRCAES